MICEMLGKRVQELNEFVEIQTIDEQTIPYFDVLKDMTESG